MRDVRHIAGQDTAGGQLRRAGRRAGRIVRASTPFRISRAAPPAMFDDRTTSMARLAQAILHRRRQAPRLRRATHSAGLILLALAALGLGLVAFDADTHLPAEVALLSMAAAFGGALLLARPEHRRPASHRPPRILGKARSSEYDPPATRRITSLIGSPQASIGTRCSMLGASRRNRRRREPRRPPRIVARA